MLVSSIIFSGIGNTQEMVRETTIHSQCSELFFFRHIQVRSNEIRSRNDIDLEMEMQPPYGQPGHPDQRMTENPTLVNPPRTNLAPLKSQDGSSGGQKPKKTVLEHKKKYDTPK